MNDMVVIEPVRAESATITLTSDYVVFKGKHYRLMNWYIKKSTDGIAVSTKDILSIDFIKMRSKRVLILFVVFATIFLTYGKTLKVIEEGVYVMLLILCALSLLYYVFGVFRFCRVTARGCMVAVKAGYYQKKQLEYLISCWNSMRNGL